MMSSTYNRMKREAAELERQLEGYKIGAEEEAAEADRLRDENAHVTEQLGLLVVERDKLRDRVDDLSNKLDQALDYLTTEQRAMIICQWGAI